MALINKDWKFTDIFALSPVELDKLKVQVANKVQCKYKNVGSRPFTYHTPKKLVACLPSSMTPQTRPSSNISAS